MKVTQTGPRDQRKSYGLYKQTLGKADPIIVRRQVPLRQDITHPSSRKTARQRARLTRASQYASSPLGSDTAIITQASRLSFTSKAGTTGGAKVLMGRQAAISQAIRSQQLGHTIKNFAYPCFTITDLVGQPFSFTFVRFKYETSPIYGAGGTQLQSDEFVFVPFNTERPTYGFKHTYRYGFMTCRGYTPTNHELLTIPELRLSPSIVVMFWRTDLYKAIWWPHYLSNTITPLEHTPGIAFHGRMCHKWDDPSVIHQCELDFTIEYTNDTDWLYTFTAFDWDAYQPGKRNFVEVYLNLGGWFWRRFIERPCNPFSINYRSDWYHHERDKSRNWAAIDFQGKMT